MATQRNERMTKKDFDQDVLHRLKTQRLLRPLMEQADVVKFLFQAMLGVGHLLSTKEHVESSITREMEELSGDPDEPLFEVLSPFWFRINLRRAKAEQLSPSVIAGLMISSSGKEQFSRRDVFDFCTDLSLSGDTAITDVDSLGSILNESWLPSHSDAYRERYHPAYRVVYAEWIPYLNIIREIAGKQSERKRMLLTIDGPCASGKTTLAQKLAELFKAAVIHTDDFVIPYAQKTAARLAIPGGNCDAERLVNEVAAPWKRGEDVKYRRYDCGLDRLLTEEAVPESDMLILEGSYCNLPSIRKFADLCLFVDTPDSIRMRRLQKRESPESLKRYHEKWIPLENAYFEAYGLPDKHCVIIRLTQT